MAASTLNLPGMPADEEILFNADLTAWEVALEVWARATVNNLNQIKSDVFGPDYSLDNDGNTNQPNVPTWQNVSEDFTIATMTLKHMPAGTTMNLGIDLAANVLSIVDGSGGALAPTNSGWGVIPSTVAGRNTVVRINEPKTVEDDGHGTTTLNMGLLGTTASVAWGSDITLFVGLYEDPNNAGEGLLFLTRNWEITTTPANANNIGIKGDDPNTSAQGNIFILEAGLAKGDHISLPCSIVGAVRATRGADATDDYTFTALGNSDGIGPDRVDKTLDLTLTMPVGQMGANAGKTWSAAGAATALQFTGTNTVEYTQEKGGYLTLIHIHDNQSAVGAVGTLVRLYGPLTAVATGEWIGDGRGLVNNNQARYMIRVAASTAYAEGPYQDNAGAIANCNDTVFANTADTIYFHARYKVF